MKFQLERPLTVAKQGMFWVIFIALIIITMVIIPDLLGGESIPKKFLASGIMWLAYGLIFSGRSIFLPARKKMKPSFLFKASALAVIVVPLWIGVSVTNWFFCELENSETNSEVVNEFG